MYQKDYIMRMIEQFMNVFNQIIFKKEIQKFDEALQDIDKALETSTGITPELLQNLNEDAVLELLQGTPGVLAAKCYIIAELYFQQSEIFEARGNDIEMAVPGDLEALSFYLEALLREPDFRTSQIFDKVAKLINKTKEFSYSPRLLKKLVNYFEMTGHYALAEDYLYQILDSEHSENPAYFQSFYQRLLEKPDRELENGNFSRNEALQGLSEIKRRLS